METVPADSKIILTAKEYNERIEKRAQEIAEERLKELGKYVLREKKDHKNGNEYIIHEKDDEGNITKTKFSNADKAILYLEKYGHPLNKASFLNLIKRLDKEVKKETVIDKIFRGRVLKIDSISRKKS